MERLRHDTSVAACTVCICAVGGTSAARSDRRRQLTVVQELEESNSKIASVLSQLEQMRPVHQLDTETGILT